MGLNYWIAVLGVGLFAGAVVMWATASRIYAADPDVTALFLALAARGDLKAMPESLPFDDGDVYYVVVECALGKARFWVQNDPYAWASSGVFTSADDPSKSLVWDGVMPNRKAIKAMKRAVGDVTKKVHKWKGENPPAHLARQLEE